MTERKVIFWLPEGPLLALDRYGYYQDYGYILYIEDLNPELKVKWALSRKHIFKIALALFLFAIRGR